MAPAPERRKTTTIQMVAVGINFTLAAAVAGLAFRSGQVEQQVQDMRTQLSEQAKEYNAAQLTISSAVARIDVVEAKAESTTELVRGLKEDMTDRLRRIEDKIDVRGKR